ncbi:MAG: thiamine-phosphate kinase [Bacteroidales bacterium]|nr:thiamine-phosphate kinase [Bacteroidales bacterium]
MHASKESNLSDLGEFGLIGRIRERFPAPEGVTGIGDDCAVIPQRSGRDTLVSTDMLIEGTHFLRRDIPPYRLGWKSAAVNISDIAAMGGQPTATFLSVALPADLETGWMEEFLRGYADISRRFGVALLGGDTTASPDRICLNVAVLGECPSGTARLRSAARDGDLVCVTGSLGDSAGGLKAILEGVERDTDVQALIDRHYLPLPRVAEGLRLAATPDVHAMMDISDGIGSDLKHILEASGLGAVIDVPSLQLSPALQRVCARLGWDAAALAIGGGEDYELLFTCTPEAERSLDVPHTVIGVIRDLPGIEWRGAEGPVAGFDHFKKL